MNLHANVIVFLTKERLKQKVEKPEKFSKIGLEVPFKLVLVAFDNFGMLQQSAQS